MQLNFFTSKAKVIFFLLAILLIACKPDGGNKSGISGTEEIDTRDTGADTDGYVMMETVRSIRDERQMASQMFQDLSQVNTDPPMILISKLFAVNTRIIVNEPVSQDPITGEYFDFRDDFSYRWLVSDSLYEKGRYHYQFDKDLLLLLPDQEDHFPSEWMVKSAGDVIVLVGTATFKNNNTQIRMQGTLKE